MKDVELFAYMPNGSSIVYTSHVSMRRHPQELTWTFQKLPNWTGTEYVVSNDTILDTAPS